MSEGCKRVLTEHFSRANVPSGGNDPVQSILLFYFGYEVAQSSFLILVILDGLLPILQILLSNMEFDRFADKYARFLVCVERIAIRMVCLSSKNI